MSILRVYGAGSFLPSAPAAAASAAASAAALAAAAFDSSVMVVPFILTLSGLLRLSRRG